MEDAINELKTTISASFPDAQFKIAHVTDVDGAESVHLQTTVDVLDTDEVLDLVIERVVDLIVDEGIPIHVIPLRPLERVLAEMHAADAPA
jgi:disulfide oxidoreductase YuzD